MSRTHSVSGARRIERVAAAMYNTPDPGEPGWVGSTWPPTHPEDLEWWLTRAEAAINTLTKERQNTFIAETSAAYPDVDHDEAARLVDEARQQRPNDPKPWVTPNGYRYAEFNEGEAMFGGIAYRPRPECDTTEEQEHGQKNT